MIWNNHPEILGHVGNILIFIGAITGAFYIGLFSGLCWYGLSFVYMYEKKEAQK